MDSHSAPTGQDPPGGPSIGPQGEGGKGGFGEAYGLPGPPKEGVLGPQALKTQKGPALVVTRQGPKEAGGPHEASSHQRTPGVLSPPGSRVPASSPHAVVTAGGLKAPSVPPQVLVRTEAKQEVKNRGSCRTPTNSQE